jgi:hypothetical protein
MEKNRPHTRRELCHRAITAGDSAGDNTTGDSGTLPGGKFWALRSVVDEVDVAAAPATPVSSSSTDRWWISPSKEQGFSTREFKRLEKKRIMREAALLLASELPEVSVELVAIRPLL